MLFAFSKIEASPPPDFTMTDTEGVTYNLYDELDKGKPVIIAFFNVSCATCQEGVSTLESIWLENAHQGELGWVWAMENGSASNEQIAEFFETHGGTYKTFRTAGDDSILTEQFGYNINYTPQYYVICNKEMYKTVAYYNVFEVFDNCELQVGITEENSELSINTNGFYITLKNIPNSKNTTINVIDILGRVIARQTLAPSLTEASIPKPNMNGIYIVHIQQDNGSTIAKKVLIK